MVLLADHPNWVHGLLQETPHFQVLMPFHDRQEPELALLVNTFQHVFSVQLLVSIIIPYIFLSPRLPIKTLRARFPREHQIHRFLSAMPVIPDHWALLAVHLLLDPLRSFRQQHRIKQQSHSIVGFTDKIVLILHQTIEELVSRLPCENDLLYCQLFITCWQLSNDIASFAFPIELATAMMILPFPN